MPCHGPFGATFPTVPWRPLMPPDHRAFDAPGRMLAVYVEMEPDRDLDGFSEAEVRLIMRENALGLSQP